MDEPSSIGTFDEERAAGYDDRIRRVAPGYEALQAALPSVMGTPAPDARVLVVGAGTGAEILAMARARPDWRFTAIGRSLTAGAPVAFADLFAGGAGADPERLRAAWRRWCRQTGRSGEEVRRAFAKMERELSFASAETLDDLLPEAGFAAPTRFYQFFLWGAWRTRRVDGTAEREE